MLGVKQQDFPTPIPKSSKSVSPKKKPVAKIAAKEPVAKKTAAKKTAAKKVASKASTVKTK
jgi:hypothetical protein